MGIGSSSKKRHIVHPDTTQLIRLVKGSKADLNALTNIRAFIANNPKIINTYDARGYTPLMHALSRCGPNGSSSMDTVRLLLEMGADPNFACKEFWMNPLTVAAHNAGDHGCHEAVVLLCQLPKIDVNQQVWHDDDLGNALSYAVYCERPNVTTINYLIRRGVVIPHWRDFASRITALQNAYRDV
jgi:ankyrin repeat protein